MVGAHVFPFRDESSGALPVVTRFLGTYGARFLVIDGQCRFYRGRGDGVVLGGTLEPAAAEALARNIDFAAAAWPQPEAEACSTDTGAEFLWSPERRIACECQCSGAPTPSAIGGVSALEVDLHESGAGEPVEGAAQLALYAWEGEGLAPGTAEWPLARPPAAAEFMPDPEDTPLSSDAGVRLEDAGELALLRRARTEFRSRSDVEARATPFVWRDPATQAEQRFDMLLRDALPPAMEAAIRAAIEGSTL